MKFDCFARSAALLKFLRIELVCYLSLLHNAKNCYLIFMLCSDYIEQLVNGKNASA